MPKGQKTGYAMGYKKAGMRAVKGDNRATSGALGGDKVAMVMKEQAMKESMNSKPSKNNVCMNGIGGQMLMKMNETLVNKSNYQELREAKDMSNDLSKKVKEALENMPRENIKSQDDINNYLCSAVGGKQGEMLKKMLEITIGK